MFWLKLTKNSFIFTGSNEGAYWHRVAILNKLKSSLRKVDLFYVGVNSIILYKLRYYGIYLYNTSDQFSASLVEPLKNSTQPCLASTLTERRLVVLSTLKLVEQNL